MAGVSPWLPLPSSRVSLSLYFLFSACFLSVSVRCWQRRPSSSAKFYSLSIPRASPVRWCSGLYFWISCRRNYQFGGMSGSLGIRGRCISSHCFDRWSPNSSGSCWAAKAPPVANQGHSDTVWADAEGFLLLWLNIDYLSFCVLPSLVFLCPVAFEMNLAQLWIRPSYHPLLGSSTPWRPVHAQFLVWFWFTFDWIPSIKPH